MKNNYNATGFFKKVLVLLVCCAFAQPWLTPSAKAVTCNLVVTNTKVNPTCYADCNGSLTANVTGGSGSYGYLWSNGATTQIIGSLCKGTYTVTVTDLSSNCTKVKSTILTKSRVAANFAFVNTTCGLCNGSITATGTGGNGAPYTYLWSNGVTTAANSGICANVNYTVTVTDKLGCKFTCVRKVTNVGSVVSDNNVCTTDACDPATGLPVYTPVNTDDNDVCTTDGCDPVTGVYHTPINTDDNDVCTTDGCDPVTGVYHTPVNTDDNNVCTTDGCDPITGVYHTPINTDDNDVCTTDGCDPVTGVYHTPVSTDDGNVCTTDGCDPVTGVYHTPITTPPTINCPADAVISGGFLNNTNCVDLGGGGVATVTNPNPTGPPSQVGIDFRQPRNQNHPTDPLNWTNGVNNITQSEYFEGVGVPQRIILTGLGAGSHTLRFRHEAVKHQSGDRHAYDFLMSWNQAVATAGNIGHGSLNELLNLNAQTCNGGIGATALSACSTVSNVATATISSVMGNPPNHHGIANVNDVIACFEAMYGPRTIEMVGNSAITAFNIAFDGYDGTSTGDNYAWYTISWTSASSNVMIKLAGRPAVGGTGPCGYGACYGAGSVSGAPYHFKLELLDGASTGNRDNQLMVEEPESCDLDIPVTFGNPTSNGNISVITADSVTVGVNSVTHCRRWRATNACAASECTQCIQVVCIPARFAGPENIDGAVLNVYPNPSKAKVNFDLVFEKDMKNVVLEIVNLTGQKVAELYNGNVLEGAQNHFEFDASKFNEGIYFYHLKAEGKSVTGKVVIIK